MSDIAAAVASVIDGRQSNAQSPLTVNREAFMREESSRGRGRPPLDPSQRSNSPEAIRARQRREDAKRSGRPVDTRPRFSPAAIQAPPHQPPPPPPPPPKPTPTPEQLTRAQRWISKGASALGKAASGIWRDERLQLTAEEANDVGESILEGWPELAIIDEDGAKWLAGFVVASIIADRYGVHMKGAAPPPSQRPPGDPVAIVEPPPPRGSMGSLESVTM